MTRRKLGKSLLILGFIIAAASLFYYLRISSAQSKMLAAHEESALEFEAPMQQKKDTSSEAAAASVKAEAGEKGAAGREEFESGQLIISIPKLKVEAAVVNGTSRDVLKLGPGLYENSPLPEEEGGNICIAGHRSTYGAWFRHVDRLNEGDDITLECNGTIFSYKVERVFVVDKKDWSVTEPQGYSAITLTSCHPIGSSKERIIVRGRLVE